MPPFWTTIFVIAFTVLCVRALGRLFVNWRDTFAVPFTLAKRQLLAGVVLFVVVPAITTVTLLASISLNQALGHGLSDWQWLAWWADVQADAGAPLERALLGLLPSTLGILVALLTLLSVKVLPVSAAFNYLRIDTTRALLALLLVLQPMVGVLLEVGPFQTARVTLDTIYPWLGTSVVAGHVALGVALALCCRSERWRRDFALLATPLFDKMDGARQRLARNVGDLDARIELGHGHLLAGDTQMALGQLEAAFLDANCPPRAGYLAGTAALKLGEPSRAAALLCNTGQRLQRDVQKDRQWLEVEVSIALCAARLCLADAEGALLTAEAATRLAPREPRALMMHSDALLASGDQRGARRKLQQALELASGVLTTEIRKRLAQLERTTA